MKILETKDWILLNNIIYEIYTIPDLKTMQRRVMEHLRPLIDYDAADFCLAARDQSNRLEEAVAIGCDENLALNNDENDYSREIMYSGRSLVYWESDIMTECARMQTDYYKKVYVTNGFHYSIQMVVGYEGKFSGVVTLYRKQGREDFNYYDIFVLDILKDHMAFSLHKRIYDDQDADHVLSIAEFTDKYHLTRRESEILMHILSRQDNASISEELVISLNTLKKHEMNIYRKCGVSSRMQLFKLVHS